MAALEQIPTILSKSRRVLAINKTSPELRNYSSALYVAVLHAMGHILLYYQEKAIAAGFSKATAVLVKQGAFQRTLLEKISAVSQCSNAIDKEAELCGMELAKETNQLAKKTKLITEGIYDKTGAIVEQTKEIDRKATDIQGSVEDLQSESRVRELAAIERSETAEKKAIERAEKAEEEVGKLREMMSKQCEVLSYIQTLFEKNLELKFMMSIKGSIYSQPVLSNTLTQYR